VACDRPSHRSSETSATPRDGRAVPGSRRADVLCDESPNVHADVPPHREQSDDGLRSSSVERASLPALGLSRLRRVARALHASVLRGVLHSAERRGNDAPSFQELLPLVRRSWHRCPSRATTRGTRRSSVRPDAIPPDARCTQPGRTPYPEAARRLTMWAFGSETAPLHSPGLRSARTSLFRQRAA
jgi:hypothetical protein